jgi:hypothetical protein
MNKNYTMSVEADIQAIYGIVLGKNNLTKEERKVLQRVQTRMETILDLHRRRNTMDPNARMAIFNDLFKNDS